MYFYYIKYLQNYTTYHILGNITQLNTKTLNKYAIPSTKSTTYKRSFFKRIIAIFCFMYIKKWHCTSVFNYYWQLKF